MSSSMHRVRAAGLVLLAATAMTSMRAGAEEPRELSAAAGKEIYEERCASCHGVDATGNGPAAAAMRTPPPDLTRIGERAGGTFPSPRIVEVITYGGNITAHGSELMPIWGKVFSEEGGRGRGGALHSRRSVVALMRYLQSIQK